jgi:hypothetical protein
LRALHAIRHSDLELIRRYLGPMFEFVVRPLEKYLVTTEMEE